MLISLSVRDFVLIDRVDLELRAGLCALTGETGAGKSILLDALGLCLGDRADAAAVRTGAERAQVSAEFDIADRHPARALLRETALAPREIVQKALTIAGEICIFSNTNITIVEPERR